MTEPSQTSESLNSVSASCLCGDTQLLISDKPQLKYLCHCGSCKKWTGSSFGASWLVPRSAVSFQSESALISYSDSATSSGRSLKRNFCGKCGSNVFIETDYYPDFLVVCSGIIDAPAGVDWKPDGEGWVDRKVAWLRDVDLGIKPMVG